MQVMKTVNEYVGREEVIREVILAIAARAGLTSTSHGIVRQAEMIVEEYSIRAEERRLETVAAIEEMNS